MRFCTPLTQQTEGSEIKSKSARYFDRFPDFVGHSTLIQRNYRNMRALKACKYFIFDRFSCYIDVIIKKKEPLWDVFMNIWEVKMWIYYFSIFSCSPVKRDARWISIHRCFAFWCVRDHSWIATRQALIPLTYHICVTTESTFICLIE